MIRHQEIEEVYFDDMVIPTGRRSINHAAVNTIAESIKQIGLLTPITVRSTNDGEKVELVTGAHRVAAAKKLGWDKIECIVRDCDEIDARLWEIAENLHRADLTALERADQIAEWTKLIGEKVLRQLDAKPQGGRPEGGVRAASRELGISEPDARRAVKVASLSDEAKQAARDAGLDDNRSALIEAAKHDTSSAQVHYLKNRTTDGPTFEQQIASLMTAWHKAGAEARKEFLVRIDRPIHSAVL